MRLSRCDVGHLVRVHIYECLWREYLPRREGQGGGARTGRRPDVPAGAYLCAVENSDQVTDPSVGVRDPGLQRVLSKERQHGTGRLHGGRLA